MDLLKYADVSLWIVCVCSSFAKYEIENRKSFFGIHGDDYLGILHIARIVFGIFLLPILQSGAQHRENKECGAFDSHRVCPVSAGSSLV